MGFQVRNLLYLLLKHGYLDHTEHLNLLFEAVYIFHELFGQLVVVLDVLCILFDKGGVLPEEGNVLIEFFDPRIHSYLELAVF